jgi:hypothetical protein
MKKTILITLAFLSTTFAQTAPLGGVACFSKEHALVVYLEESNKLDFYVVHDNGDTIEEATQRAYTNTSQNTVLVTTESGSKLELINFMQGDLTQASANYQGSIKLAFLKCEKM